jgi:glycosyltransferase involved in cell wall biosynthesis
MYKRKLTDIEHLKIAVIGHKRIPSREGGIEVVVEELATRMVQMGHSITCYNRSGNHVSGKEFDNETYRSGLKEYKGIRIMTVPTVERKGLAAATSSFFAAVRAAFGNYDVVHFHAEGPCVMVWLPKLFGKRVSCTVHGLDHQRADKWGRFARTYILLGEKMAVKFADEIIVLSENVRKYFKDTYGRETKFIPNGVNTPVIRDAQMIKVQFGLEKNSYILFLGRIVPEKGIRYLVEAFKNVKTDKRLVIAGGASDTDSFMTEIREMAAGDDRIVFTGFVQGQLLEELYSNSYVYTLPSDLEGMPLSLLEAMSFGNCCLTSDIPECWEVVENRAVCFKKSSVEDLRDKLQQLVDEPERVEKFQKEASDFICAKYNWSDVVQKTLELYKKM